MQLSLPANLPVHNIHSNDNLVKTIPHLWPENIKSTQNVFQHKQLLPGKDQHSHRVPQQARPAHHHHQHRDTTRKLKYSWICLLV